MSTHIRFSRLLFFSSLILAPSLLSGQSPATTTPTPVVAHEVDYTSPEWLAIQPHLPDKATAPLEKLELAGDVLRARRFPEEAVEYYMAALRRGGQETVLLNKLGVTELELHRTAVARAYFQKLTHDKKKDADGWNNLGAVDYLDGQYLAAINDYGRAIKLNKTSAIYHSNRGTAYFEKKDFEAARKDFDTALKLDPGMMEHHGAVGVSIHMLSPEDHARFCFEMARLYARRGDEIQMLHYLTVAAEGGFDVLFEMGGDKALAPYRKDPRVVMLVQNARALRTGRASADLPGGVPPLPPEQKQ